jgi:hypothetical protein
VRSAWRGFEPAAGSAFPKILLTQRAGSKLTPEIPGVENTIYLPDLSKSVLAALKHFELPVVAIETDDAKRLADRFVGAFPQGVIRASTLQTVHLVDGQPWNDLPQERLRDDAELEWLIPLLLTVVAFHGPQSQGTASRSFKKHLDTLGEARVPRPRAASLESSPEGVLRGGPQTARSSRNYRKRI